MRVAVAGHNLVLDTANEWGVAEGWNDASVQRLHGLSLRSVVHDVQIHVRAMSAGSRNLTIQGLLGTLREQQWASRPFEEADHVAGQLLVVAGTFAMRGEHQVVREFFVTDGQSLANAAMPGSRAKVAAASASAMRLVAAIRFEPSG